jgi:hypothetical protein
LVHAESFAVAVGIAPLGTCVAPIVEMFLFRLPRLTI